jgi:hypothetical protein
VSRHEPPAHLAWRPLAAAATEREFFGTGGHSFVGPDDERWDLVMLIRQASVDDFLAFASNDAYLAGIGHRTAALEDSDCCRSLIALFPEETDRALRAPGEPVLSPR